LLDVNKGFRAQVAIEQHFVHLIPSLGTLPKRAPSVLFSRRTGLSDSSVGMSQENGTDLAI
jgi:hypothetical protein